MYMVQFHELFPEEADQEMLVIEMQVGGEPGPIFLVREAYCPDSDCNCREVALNVIREDSGEQVVTIIHFFDEFSEGGESTSAGVEEQTYLDPEDPQTEWADDVLETVRDALERSDYQQMLEEHYQMVKDADVDAEELGELTTAEPPEDVWEPLFRGKAVVDEMSYMYHVDALFERFVESPEFDQLRQEYPMRQVSWLHWMFDALFDYERREIDQIDPAFLDWMLMDLFPRKISAFGVDGAEAVAELRAFFEFVHRQTGYDNAAECAEYLDQQQLGEQFEEAMADETRFGMAKSIVHMGQEAGFDMTDEDELEAFMDTLNTVLNASAFRSVQQPFEKEEVEVGRNAPCPCGSGKKYKKCCLRRLQDR